jgi:hypothetical protein
VELTVKTLPPEVLEAARIVERWAAENNIRSWKIGALASRQELELTAARYAEARQLGVDVDVEIWRGIGRERITGEEYDRLIDGRIAKARLTLGEIVEICTDYRCVGDCGLPGSGWQHARHL